MARPPRGIALFVFGLIALAGFLAAGAAPVLAARTTVLTGVRYWSSVEKTRIVIDASQATNFRAVLDAKDNVYRISLGNAVLAPDVQRTHSLEDGLIGDLRLAEVPDGLEVLLALQAPREIQPFALPAGDAQPYRIVVDVPRKGMPLLPEHNPLATRYSTSTPQSRSRVTTSRTSSPPPQAVAPPPVRYTPQPIDDRIVVIDPGHGGEHAGAVGYRRLREKDICLQISRKLAIKLNEQPGVTALLTRTGDYNVALRDRYRFADSCRADAFVSIHSNSSRRRTSAGTEVYFLSLGSASDEQAKLLADIENAADIVEGGNEFEEDVTAILFDLKQNDVIRQSERLAEAILDELTQDRRLSSRGVKQAPFAVLKSPITPAVLVETAFINNPNEAKLLRDPAFQDHLADQIADGILSFLSTTPTVVRGQAAVEFFSRAVAEQNPNRGSAD